MQNHRRTEHPKFVDADTGEVVEWVAIPRSDLQQRHRARTPGGFFMSMHDAMHRIARDRELTDGDMRVLFELLGHLNYENWIHVSQADVARELGRSPQAVNRSMKRLVERGVLHRGPRKGRMTTYRIDPGTSWMGDGEVRARVRREIDQRGWQVVDGGSAPDEIPGQTSIDDELDT